jgi:hypothetical protein
MPNLQAGLRLLRLLRRRQHLLKLLRRKKLLKLPRQKKLLRQKLLRQKLLVVAAVVAARHKRPRSGELSPSGLRYPARPDRSRRGTGGALKQKRP